MHTSKDHTKFLYYLMYLVEESQVSRAAKKACISQSMMSHALKQLRLLLDDPLFIQVGRDLVPTERALNAYEHIKKGVDNFDFALQNLLFDPHESHEFTVLATDYAALVVLSPFIKIISNKYPNIQISVFPMKTETYVDQLIYNEADVVIGFIEEVSKSLVTNVLFCETFICLSRKNHPDIEKPLDLNTYVSLQHIAVQESDGAIGFVNRALKPLNISRKIHYKVPFFTMAPYLVESTNAVIATGQKLATHFSSYLELDIHELPLVIPKIPLSLGWCNTQTKNPKNTWLRNEIIKSQELLK